MKIWLPFIATGTGAEVYARRLAEALTERGHTVALDAAPHRYQYAPWLAGLHPPPNVDVVLGNSWTAAALPKPAPLVTVVHHVVHAPHLDLHKSVPQRMFHRAFVRPMERRALRKSAAVVAVSKATAAAVRDHLADVPIEVILNGVDTNYFRPPAEPVRHDEGSPLRLLFVGTPSLRKGFDTAAAIVGALGSTCRFTCIGPEPPRGMPRPTGRYLGRVSPEALLQAYQQSDLLLMPSRLEGFGYAAAEAMSCGLPVLCAESGAVAEIIPSAGSAIVRPAEDVSGFVSEVRTLAAQPERLMAMRSAVRDHAVTFLDKKRWVDQMEALLCRVARTAPPGAQRD